VDLVRTALQLARLHEGVMPPMLERALMYVISTHAALAVLERGAGGGVTVTLSEQVEGTVGRVLQGLIRSAGPNTPRAAAYKALYRTVLHGPTSPPTKGAAAAAAAAEALSSRLARAAAQGAADKLLPPLTGAANSAAGA
jgi:hypothetical protein